MVLPVEKDKPRDVSLAPDCYWDLLHGLGHRGEDSDIRFCITAATGSVSLIPSASQPPHHTR